MDKNNNPKLLIPQEEDQKQRLISELEGELSKFQKEFFLKENHDCHLSPNDSCETCEELFLIKDAILNLKLKLKKLYE